MLSDRDHARCLERFIEHQRAERERVLCKRGIIRRVREGGEHDCEECGKSFAWTEHMTVRYTTTKETT